MDGLSHEYFKVLYDCSRNVLLCIRVLPRPRKKAVLLTHYPAVVPSLPYIAADSLQFIGSV